MPFQKDGAWKRGYKLRIITTGLLMPILIVADIDL